MPPVDQHYLSPVAKKESSTWVSLSSAEFVEVAVSGLAMTGEALSSPASSVDSSLIVAKGLSVLLVLPGEVSVLPDCV